MFLVKEICVTKCVSDMELLFLLALALSYARRIRAQQAAQQTAQRSGEGDYMMAERKSFDTQILAAQRHPTTGTDALIEMRGSM